MVLQFSLTDLSKYAFEFRKAYLLLAKKILVIFFKKAKYIFGVFLFFLSSLANSTVLYVAVSSNAQDVFKELQEAFEEKTGIRIQSVIGASGKLATQIQHGAPFDVFLSADMLYPHKLYQLNLTIEPPKIYARGRLIIWTFNKNIQLKKWQKALLSPTIKKIVIAHPDLAPYGKEALRILRLCKAFDAIKAKLIYADSIAQVNQYIAMGYADIALTAQSTVFNSFFYNKGQWINIQEAFHPFVDHGVVILKSTQKRKIAKIFVDFLHTPTANRLFKRYGYQVF